MNAKTQLDFHPDAESLNAFAERSLAEGERGQIAAHLAICGRCRQVVFLAQAAATEEVQLATASTGRLEKRRMSWFRNWWLLWAPVAALATVVALAFYVHLRSTAVDVEMAKAPQAVSPLAGPQNETVTARPAATPPAEATGVAVSGVAARKPEMKKSNAQAAPPPGPVEPMVPAPSAVNALDAPSAAMAKSSEAERATQTEERASASGEEKGAREQEQLHGSMRAAAAPVFNASAAQIAGLTAEANKTSTRALSVYAAPLPSGLPADSKATGSKVTVAVDKAGAVFVTTNAGGHWESVVRQWSGQAVAVRMQANAQGVYELVNDQGQIWVSTDGRIWTTK